MSDNDPKYAWEGKNLDEHAAKELYLYITNDGDLYRQQYSPINKSLTIKKARGVYDSAKAVKLFMYLVDNGGRKYVKEFGSSGDRIDSIFPRPVRLAVAEELRDFFEAEYALGNYDNFIPKKYREQPAKVKVVKRVAKRAGHKSQFTSLGGMR